MVEWRKYFTPCLSLLREVTPKKVVDSMLSYTKECAQAMGAEAVLIPTNPHIFSNREELHGIIEGMHLGIYELSHTHQFSYSPFTYSWKEAFVIPL